MMSFGDVIMSGDVILQCFVLCYEVDRNRKSLCLGTMTGRGHNILFNGYHPKIVKALTCYLRCFKSASRVVTQLAP